MQREIVTYNYLEQCGIHEFIFDESSRKGMDEYFSILHEIYDEYLKDKCAVGIILDIHKSGMLPVRYASAMMESLFKELVFPTPYIAYLTDNTADNSLINTMAFTASDKVTRLHFYYEQRDEAITWLLGQLSH